MKGRVWRKSGLWKQGDAEVGTFVHTFFSFDLSEITMLRVITFGLEVSKMTGWTTEVTFH